MDANNSPRQKCRRFLTAMVVEVFNDTGPSYDMLAGSLPRQVVLQFRETSRLKALDKIHPYLLKTVDNYRVSVKSLFIFEIFEETLRSIVRSPISTTKPPLISGLTLRSVSFCEEPIHATALYLGYHLKPFALTIL